MRYIFAAVIALLVVNIGVIFYSALLVTSTIKASAQPIIFEAEYYEVDNKKIPGKNLVKQIGEARLQWNKGKLEFVDGGLPIADSARAFLVEAAKVYNEMPKTPPVKQAATPVLAK